jgi:hypothetical protein
MNNLDLTDFIDAEEGRDEVASYGCKNCGATTNLTDFWPDDQPKPVTLCEDCCEAQAAVEAEADRLSALPSCDYRLMIIDRSETVQQLVNALRAHDMTPCFACASTRKTVQTDRLYVNPAAVCCEGVA